MLNVVNIRKKKIVIIADDLTGANEIASVTVKEGKKPLVLIHPQDNHVITELWKSYDSLAVNLNSRNLSAQRANDTVKNFLEGYQDASKGRILSHSPYRKGRETGNTKQT